MMQMFQEKELAQAKAVADAAKKAGVKHVVWSTLEHTPSHGAGESIPAIEMNGEPQKVPHMDAKGMAYAYFQEIRVPTTCLWTSLKKRELYLLGHGA